MRVKSMLVTVFVVLLYMIGLASASLVTIGTAKYNGSDYNLIYDADAPNGPIVWMDYSHPMNKWQDQVDWAAGLNASGVLTYNFNTDVTMDWSGDWRLPTTKDGVYNWGYDGTTTGGYNIVTSEMGHLYYGELANLGYYGTDGTHPQTGWGLNNTGDFSGLKEGWYWSGTGYGSDQERAWEFCLSDGRQFNAYKHSKQYGLAVRSGEMVSAVPTPGALWLLGSGLLGLVAVRRRQ